MPPPVFDLIILQYICSILLNKILGIVYVCLPSLEKNTGDQTENPSSDDPRNPPIPHSRTRFTCAYIYVIYPARMNDALYILYIPEKKKQKQP